MKKLKLFFALFAMLALGVGNAWAEEATLSFASTAQRTVRTNEQQVWEQNGITFTNNKSSSTTNVGDYSNPARLYAKSEVIVECSLGNINKIVFVCGSSSYATALKNSIGTTATTEVSGSNVTATLGGTSESFTIASLTAQVRIKSLTVTYTPSTGGSETPIASVTLDPDVKDFGTIKVGETLSQEFTITTENTTAALTASIDNTTDYAVSAIAGNKVTVTYQPQSPGTHPAVLTVKAGEEATATVNLTGKAVQALEGTWILVTDASSLTVGSEIIIAAKESDYALSTTQNGNNRGQVEVTKTDNTITATTEAQVLTLQTGNVENTLALYTGAGYLCAASSGSNYLRTETELSGNSSWTIAVEADGTATLTAQGTYTRNIMQHNATSKIFACYGSASQKALSLYRKAGTQYNVNVSATENGMVNANPTSAEKGTTITLTVTPAGGYLLDALTVTDASSNPITVTDNTFTMPESDVTVAATFKLNEKPAATLTLSMNGVTENLAGSHKQDDVVTLPTTVDTDCVKEFVGWSADANCATEPEYAPGASYTLASTSQTLYAVYADVEETTTTAAVNIQEYASANSWGSTSSANQKNIQINSDITAIISEGTNSGKYYNDGVRLYQTENATITISTTSGELKSVNFTFTNNNDGTLLNNGVAMTSGTAVEATGTSATYTIGDTNPEENKGQIRISAIEVIYGSAPTYSNYSTTCAAAPKAEVNPAEVTATATGGNGTVSVTYENVNTESVAVALYNDEACTEAFTTGWLTASLDGDKNVTYTVAENTTYAERKAYIQLTAPEANGATDPAVVVIPVTQAGKDKVFASLAELVAADLTAGDEVTVTLNNDMIKSFYTITAGRAGVVFDVQKNGKDIKIFFNNQTTIVDWEVGGKLSGTLTNVKWTTYSDAWQLAPANTWAWANLNYTAPATIASIAVTGTPTKTTYTDGEAFDPAGLVATATYTDDTQEDVTNLVSWTFDPATLTKGQTSVNVVALLNSVSSPAYEVTGLTVNDIPTKTVAEFIAAGGVRCYLEGIVSSLTEGNSMKYGNFDLTDASGTIYVYGCLNASGEKEKFAELGVKNGDKIKVIADEYELYGGTKDEAKNVQYVSHISAATITIENITLVEGDEHTIVAVVTPAEAVVTYTIKENTANAISLLDNTITALAEGTATITATVAEGAGYLANSVEFTVTVKEYVAPISGIWELVTDASTLKAGDKVIVAQYVETDGTIYTMGGQKTNNRDVVESSVLGETLTPITGTAVLTLVDAGNGTFALQASNGNYLYAASNTSNHLKETATINDNAKWSVSVTDGKASVVAQGANTHNTIRFNKSNTPKIFSCYASGQQDIALYKRMPDYTREVRQGFYGTICLPNGGMMFGASIFEIAYKDASKIYFDEILSNEMVAGIPYIFLPSDGVDQIEVYYTDELNAPAGSKNGLVGSYTQELLAVDGNNYILLNNQYCEVIGEAYVGANRAYFQLGSIPSPAFAPVLAPGARRVSMGMAGQNTATGMENVDASAQPVKTIINGQLYILRGEKMYDAQGKLVK